MTTDPIADMLTRIRNGYLAQKLAVEVPYSRLKESLADVLVKNGYIKSVEKKEKEKPKAVLVIRLVYKAKEPAITEIVRVSKPGLRHYVSYKSIPRVLSGMGIVIISTPKGLLTGLDAKRQKVGGEVLCKVW